jgi:hypothetical protein
MELFLPGILHSGIFFKKNSNFYLTARANSAKTVAMETNHKLFKTGKALLFITSGLLLSGACLQARPWTTEEDQILTDAVQNPKYRYLSGQFNWVAIAKQMEGRTGDESFGSRYQKKKMD